MLLLTSVQKAKSSLLLGGVAAHQDSGWARLTRIHRLLLWTSRRWETLFIVGFENTWRNRTQWDIFANCTSHMERIKSVEGTSLKCHRILQAMVLGTGSVYLLMSTFSPPLRLKELLISSNACFKNRSSANKNSFSLCSFLNAQPQLPITRQPSPKNKSGRVVGKCARRGWQRDHKHRGNHFDPRFLDGTRDPIYLKSAFP